MAAQEKRKKWPGFVPVFFQMLHDQNFKRLSPSAKLLWLYLRGQYKHSNPLSVKINPATDNLVFSISENDFKDVNGLKSYNTRKEALKQLKEGGWIVQEIEGGKCRQRSWYSFQDRYSQMSLRKKRDHRW